MILNCDVLDGLRQLPDNSVQCCVTSPPYFGLRDYGCDGQIGLEETPDIYVAKLVTVFSELRRVMKDDGVFFLNIGDSYAGSGMGAANYPDCSSEKQMSNHGSTTAKGRGGMTYGLKPKDLIGIPWMLAFTLRADGWYLRQDIIWHKPNPMPESVTDRCTKAHEYVFLLTKSARYYYDHEAIKEPANPENESRYNYSFGGDKNELLSKSGFGKTKPIGMRLPHKNIQEDGQQPNSFHIARANGEKDDVYLSRNKRSVWSITVNPYREAHFATYPEDLVEPCIKAGSKIDDVVLDPFAGSGTTLAVAKRLGRKHIGIELNTKYITLIERRLSQVVYQGSLL